VYDSNQKVEISRFKGLGEMPTAYLRATTMDPRNRVLLRVTLPERTETPSAIFQATLDLVESLMGRRPAALRLHPEERPLCPRPRRLRANGRGMSAV
jgi:DNA gyrase/topoisomerase IV subunit B